MRKTRPLSSLPPSFSRTYYSQEKDLLTEFRPGSNSPLIKIKNTYSTAKKNFQTKAMKMKKEILQWLADENPPPAAILKKVSECPTEYSKLISMVSEELEYSVSHTMHEKLDELDRDSSLNAVKLDVEIQQFQERLIRLTRDKNEIKGQLKIATDTLNKLNREIDMIQTLAASHGVTESNVGMKKSQMNFNDELYMKMQSQEQKLDEEAYRSLWLEQQNIEETLENLHSQLKEAQESQLNEMRKYIRRKYYRFNDLPV